MMDEDLLEDPFSQIRQALESQVSRFRSEALPGQKWPLIHSRLEPIPSRNEVLQTYLLLRIIDLLESIDDTLATMGNDSWNDHHNK